MNVVEHYSAFWRDEVLIPQDSIAASGVAYHLADLLLEELGNVLIVEETTIDSSTANCLLEPFCVALATTTDGVLLQRLQHRLFAGVADELRHPRIGDPLCNFNALAFSQHLFDLGKSISTHTVFMPDAALLL